VFFLTNELVFLTFKKRMKKQYWLPILIILTLFNGACTQNAASTNPGYEFSPAVPGGSIGTATSALPVTDASADTSVFDQITLNWTVPAIYLPLDYRIRIYKYTGISTSFTLPDPTQNYTSASLYLLADVQGNQYVDTNTTTVTNINPDTGYTYWIYIFVDNLWSPPVELTPTSQATSTSFAFPPAATFWQNIDWTFGYTPSGTSSLSPTGNTVTTLSPGTPSIGNQAGKTAFAYEGAVMYVADTENNRIVVYTEAEALACDQYTDPTLYSACLYGAQGYPFTATNVLGQPNQYTTTPCTLGCGNNTTSTTCGNQTGCGWDSTSNTCSPTFGLDQCLTRPTSVVVAGTSLFISDSGNNRIVVWEHLPTTGCDPDIVVDQTTTPDCTADYQIGKQSLTDETTYSLATAGNMALNNPSGVAFGNSQQDIYIADTNNNRVVQIQNFTGTSFDCSPSNWGTSFCQFTGVLGQPTFFTSNSFNSFIANDNTNQETCLNQTTQSACATATGCYWTPTQINGVCQELDTIINGTGIGNQINQTVWSNSTCTQLLTQANCNNPPNNLENPPPPGACTWSGTACSATASSNVNILKRYFANPTTIKITTDNQLLVEANENYSVISTTTGNPIELYSRIMVFNPNPLDASVTPATCTPYSFTTGGCDATAVIGQQNFNTLVPLSSSSAKYSDTTYALQSLVDFDILGSLMIGVDSQNNSVYLWNNWSVSKAVGNPPDSTIANPNGAPNPSAATNLPILEGLGAVTIEPVMEEIYITDPVADIIYQVRTTLQ
jgi:hypothetical protein